MPAAISLSGLVKDFGRDARPRPSRPDGSSGRGARLPRARTAPARRPRSASCSGCCARTAARRPLLGGDPWRDAVALHRRLAYVPGEVNLWPNLTGGEVIDLLGRAARRPRSDAGAPSCSSGSSSTRPRRCRAYSKGNRQKVALVAAFASDVELYLLDEPTSGLDPLMEAVFQDVVRELRDAGRTVLLSSHILSEVEALCDRVTIIRAGRAAESGTFDELRHLTRTTVVVETAQPLGGARRRSPGVHDAARRRHACAVQRRPRRARTGVLEHLVELDVRVADQLAADARGAVPAPLRRRHRDRATPSAELVGAR